MGPDADVSYPGDELDGVWESLPFIEALKTGSPPDVGRRVAVIGGGNTAIDVAIESARLGAESVTMIYRRSEAEMPAYPHEVEQARAEGVTSSSSPTPSASSATAASRASSASRCASASRTRAVAAVPRPSRAPSSSSRPTRS